MNNQEIGACMTIKLDAVLPEYPKFDPKLRRAPRRDLELSDHEMKLALKNALRYVRKSSTRRLRTNSWRSF